MPSSSSLKPQLNFFLLRTPLLAFDLFRQWGEGQSSAGSLDNLDELELAWQRDFKAAADYLMLLLETPEFQEAIYLASPEMIQQLRRSSDFDPQFICSLARYFTRATSRAVPFGTFTAFSMGHVGDKTTFSLGSILRRTTCLDYEYLSKIADNIARSDKYRKNVPLILNPCFSYFATQVRFAEPLIRNDERDFFLAEVELPEQVLTLLLSKEIWHHEELVGHLKTALKSSDALAYQYAELLKERGILTHALAPPLTDGRPELWLADKIDQCGAQAAAETLREVRSELDKLDKKRLGSDIDLYDQLFRKLNEMVEISDRGRLFQVDLWKTGGQVTISQELIETVWQGAKALHTWLPATDESLPLSEFKDRFLRRFGDTQVCLTKALDHEYGVGFGHITKPMPLLDGIQKFEVKQAQGQHFSPQNLALLLECLKEGKTQIDLANLSGDATTEDHQHRPLPSSFAVKSALQLSDDGFQVLIRAVDGPNPARLLARPSISNPELKERVREQFIQEAKENEHALFAEVVHIPSGRSSNMVRRPSFLNYEIRCFAQETCNGVESIEISDLLVSVVGNKVRLHSKRHKKEVIVRHTSAHNDGPSDWPSFMFFCELQRQSIVHSLKWDWGELNRLKFLPRINFGRAILARARWNIEKREIDRAIKAKGHQRFAEVCHWKNNRELPKMVVWVNGDDEWLIDFENVLSVENFVLLIKRFLKTETHFHLEEAVGVNNSSPIVGNEGSYVHDVIFPFSPSPSSTTGQAQEKDKPREENFSCYPPGSEWLYIKLYGAPNVVDEILSTQLAELAQVLTKSESIRNWFFIRYNDPEHHIRLRFQGNSQELLANTLPQLTNLLGPLVTKGRLWNYELTTYQPEILRYGGPHNHKIAEQLFGIDSSAVLRLLSQEISQSGAERWQWVALGLHKLLNDFKISYAERSRLLLHARDTFGTELHLESAPAKHEVAAKFRTHRRWLQRVLAPEAVPPTTWQGGINALSDRTLKAEKLIAQLSFSSADQKNLFIQSLLHMHCNRMFITKARGQEAVLYEILRRFYTAEDARSRRAS